MSTPLVDGRAARPGALARSAILSCSPWDTLLVGLALVQGALYLILCRPVSSVPVLAAATFAIGLWWSSNTVSHWFIHRPFFRWRSLNGIFSLYLSVLIGVPQRLWRWKHLAHHAADHGGRVRLRWTPLLGLELAAVGALWSALLVTHPAFFLTTYLPAWGLGLALCQLHGHYEHAAGTVSHHGRLYNLLFFNDGFHVEHHAAPCMHWRRLPQMASDDVATSSWPAVLRWLDADGLDHLERLVRLFKPFQWFVLGVHERAFRRLLGTGRGIRRVGIIGGGIFPRTALILERLLPGAELTIIDGNARSISLARERLRGEAVVVEGWYDPAGHRGFDLLVVPLAYRGDRQRFYDEPTAPRVLVHDWLWRRRGRGVRISWLLLKRLNLVGDVT